MFVYLHFNVSPTRITDLDRNVTDETGFLLGIFFRGGKFIVMQISFVVLLFSDQISGRGKRFQGGKLPQGGRLPVPPSVEESQEKIYRYGTVSFVYVFVFIKLVCVQSVI